MSLIKQGNCRREFYSKGADQGNAVCFIGEGGDLAHYVLRLVTFIVNRLQNDESLKFLRFFGGLKLEKDHRGQNMS